MARSDPSTAVVTRGSFAGQLTMTMAVALTEGLLLYGLVMSAIGWPLFIGLHGMVVVALGVYADWFGRSGRDTGPALLTLISVAATGVIGALASVVLMVAARRGGADPKLLRAWYQRIANAADTDEITRLCEQVATGRTADLMGVPPASYSAIMRNGSLDDRQTTLGIIARNFHPDYLPALTLALKNPEPVIRVQAAAVATRVRGDLRSLIDRQAGAGAAPLAGSAEALTIARQLEAAIASGLLDESDRIRAVVIVSRLVASDLPARLGQPLQMPPILAREAVEARLIEQRRFGQFRVGRRIAAIARRGGYRVRRARSRPAIAEAG